MPVHQDTGEPWGSQEKNAAFECPRFGPREAPKDRPFVLTPERNPRRIPAEASD